MTLAAILMEAILTTRRPVAQSRPTLLSKLVSIKSTLTHPPIGCPVLTMPPSPLAMINGKEIWLLVTAAAVAAVTLTAGAEVLRANHVPNVVNKRETLERWPATTAMAKVDTVVSIQFRLAMLVVMTWATALQPLVWHRVIASRVALTRKVRKSCVKKQSFAQDFLLLLIKKTNVYLCTIPIRIYL